MTSKETPSQTAGPYVHIGCVPSVAGLTIYGGRDPGAAMLTELTEGDRIVVTGRILDGDGTLVTDAVVEAWQADARGRYGTAAFPGWGRQATDGDTGLFRFETIGPGATDGQAPHIALWIVARGINLGLHTRLYFADAPENAIDPVLRGAGDRAGTMIAQVTAEGVHLDIHLQGENETVFLDV